MSVKRIDVYTIYLTHVLGKGSFGNVYRGINQQTNQPVAVKVIPRYAIDHDEYLKASLTNQIKILQSVKSEYIVGFYDVMESPKNYYIIEELCDGDLSKIIRQGQNLPQSYCIDILTQICEGFIALVKEGIIHRDLKPANILRRGNVFKIGDFGFSKQLNIPKNVPDKIQKVQELKMKTSVGTPLYMSIQILKSIQYTSKCDIWALGFIFYEMLHGKTPWTAQRQFQLVTNIETQSLKIQRQDLSQHTVDFLKRCLQVYQKDRISWNQIFTHPIFQSKFLAFADQNKEFQNKMKGIMTRLRFYFHLNKNYLEEYLNKNGFKNTNEELSFESYYDFLRVVHPTINQQEAMYIFKKTDIDGNGSISLDQILVMLKKYGIALQQTQLDRPEISFNRTLSHRNESQKKIAQQKIEQCFKKLYKIIIKNSLTLQRVFSDFDKAKKGYLTLKQFKNMVQKLSKDITDQDAKLAFQMMDDDDSGSLEYSEINKHFKEINSIDQNSNI